MKSPEEYLLFMTYSGLVAVILYRIRSNKWINRWLLLRTAKLRGKLRAWRRELARVDWFVVRVVVCVLLVAALWGFALPLMFTPGVP